MKYRCVIFDCDGTLVDTLEDIAASMNRALAACGFSPLPVENYAAMVGWGIEKLAWLVLPAAERTGENVEKVSAEAARLYYGNPLGASRPYPGMAELAAALAAGPGGKKIRRVVLSNKPEPVLRRVIDGLFPPGAFDVVWGDRPGASRKPDPAPVWDILAGLDRTPGETILMGDSEVDMETARNAGCFPLGVSWGYRPRHILEKAGAARIIDRPEEAWKLLFPD